MLKPSTGILCRDPIESLPDRLPESLDTTLIGPSQMRFELGEEQLNGVEVRRVGRQRHDPTPGGFDEHLGIAALMHAEVVPDDYLSWSQLWHQKLRDKLIEDRPVHRAFDDGGSLDTIKCHGRHQRCVLAPVARHLGDAALSTWRPPVAWRQRDVGATLIDKDQLFSGNILDLSPPGSARLWILFAGAQPLFLRVNSRCCRVRHMVAALTLTPLAAVHCSP